MVHISLHGRHFTNWSLVEAQHTHGGSIHQEMKVVWQQHTRVAQQAIICLRAPRAPHAVLHCTLARTCRLQQPLFFVLPRQKPYQFLLVPLILLQQTHGHLLRDAAQVYFGKGSVDGREEDTSRSDSAMCISGYRGGSTGKYSGRWKRSSAIS